MIRNCLTCRRDYKTKPSTNKKFCSMNCYENSGTKPLFRKGNAPVNTGSNSGSFKKGHKPSERWLEIMKGRTPVNKGKGKMIMCKTCETQFQDSKHSNRRKYCSQECKRIGVSNKNHYNWKGGEQNPLKILRSSYEYKKWRQEVFKRDYWTCQICNIKGKKIWADHVKPFALYPEERFNIENGRTVCIDCALKLDTHGNRVFRKEAGADLTIVGRAF